MTDSRPQDQELLGYVVVQRDRLGGGYDTPIGLGLVFEPDDRESAAGEASKSEDYFVAEVRREV